MNRQRQVEQEVPVISGYVDLTVQKKNGESNPQTVDGGEFGLEEGGEWSRDPDDGQMTAGFLYVAFRGAFDLILSFNVHGSTITHYSLSVREVDLASEDIHRVLIDEDALEISVNPPEEEND